MLAVSRALSLAKPEGYIRLFADEGAPVAALLRQASSRGLGGAYVRSLLEACGAGAMSSAEMSFLIEPLSGREQELLTLLAAGLSTSEVAGQLFITTGTVRNHLKSIYGKLDVHSRLQAVQRAQSLNLLASR
jgi:LuxR family maltose regulon positive regulatory protein